MRDSQITDNKVIRPNIERRMLYPWSRCVTRRKMKKTASSSLLSCFKMVAFRFAVKLRLLAHATTMLMYFDGEHFAMSS
ncbi:hypothetical protein T01_1291, partial [Trichinella spiralis]